MRVRILQLLLILVAVLAGSGAALAKITVLTEKCSYVMGDNDTKNDARKLCFLQAKRKILERAGTYIRSQVKISQGKLTADQILSFSAAILNVETTNEKISFNGQNMVMELAVKARVDLEDVRSKLDQISGNHTVRQKILRQQSQLRSLESEVAELRIILNKANANDAKSLRKRRNVVIQNIDSVENLRIIIAGKIANASRLAVSNVELGMTRKEVIQLAGRPRSVHDYAGDVDLNYGSVWVTLENGVVACVVKSISFEWARSCSSYRRSHRNLVVK